MNYQDIVMPPVGIAHRNSQIRARKLQQRERFIRQYVERHDREIEALQEETKKLTNLLLAILAQTGTVKITKETLDSYDLTQTITTQYDARDSSVTVTLRSNNG